MKPDNEFERLALPLRREVVAYCYRMTAFGAGTRGGDGEWVAPVPAGRD